MSEKFGLCQMRCVIVRCEKRKKSADGCSLVSSKKKRYAHKDDNTPETHIYKRAQNAAIFFNADTNFANDVVAWREKDF